MSAISERTRRTALSEKPVRNFQSASPPLWTRPLREASTIERASKSVTRSCAVIRPRPPSPPVMRWAPPCCGPLTCFGSPACTTITAWPRRKPSPLMARLWQKPLSARMVSHCRQLSSGLSCPTRSTSRLSANSHQPSVMPKVIWMKVVVVKPSLATSMPPSFSSCAQWRSVLPMKGVACSTFVATMASCWCEAKPWRRGSASMLSSMYSRKENSEKRTRAWRRKTSDTSVKTYRSHDSPRTGSTLDAVPPEPAPTSRTIRRCLSGSRSPRLPSSDDKRHSCRMRDM